MGSKYVKNMKKKFLFNRGIAFAIVILFIGITVGISVSTGSNNYLMKKRNAVSVGNDINNVGIATTFSTISTSEKMPESKLEKLSTIFPIKRRLIDETNFPIFSMNDDCQNPAVVTDKCNKILVLSEMLEDPLSPMILARWSEDRGYNWIPENEIIGWQFEDDVKRPKIDYYGKNSTAWGTLTAGSYNTGLAYYFMFPDITQPYPMYEDYWELWYADWEYHLGYTNFDSADVACYSDELNVPSPDFFGVIVLTGDSPQNPPEEYEDNTIAISYFINYDVTIFHFYNMTEDCKKVSAEIDQSNGRLYIVCEYENNSQFEDGTLILYHDISSEEEWYLGEWSGYYFEGLFNPGIAVDNGAVCVVGEMERNGEKDIVCYYSLDAGQNFSESLVTDTLNENECFPSITSGIVSIPTKNRENESILCSYIKNGNIYISDSWGHGESWEEFPIKVNDENGIPVEQYCGMCIEDIFIAWTDTRNNLFEIYFDRYEYPPYSWPEIEINHRFCLNITAEVILENQDAYDAYWNIQLDGGILFTNRTASGLIEKIPAGTQTRIGTGLVFGFGKILITVEANPWFGNSDIETANGFVLGPFIYVFP